MTNSKKNKEFSTARNLLRGVGSLLNVFSGYYHEPISRFVTRSDKSAMKSDWESIGNDFKIAIKKNKFAK